ncbi:MULTISPECIES: inner membrane-spanning protein YciB [Roseovarius]|jgi:intracellular septation protein|uniref:inner membrane-spanning protein YciB n=1 Tax=Roseovarius TaxID=74030 RepID=UPI000C5CDD6D|nr:inner membrane-spanning protein YciB [Roseovarius sp.]MAZ20035.1 intracellular septation protein A [Roseovarius sp.]|tara:strand:+ start:2486 stop:3094 length:609 start_codon:yes stop_codon:yes gene_type:complete
MAEKKINGALKTALELGPIAAFFVAYLWLKDEVFTIGGTEYDGFVVVTAGFIPVFLASIAALWWLTGHLSRMQVVTAVLIVVFGGLSVWFNDPRFFKMKPTIIYLLFGGVLGAGLLRGQSYLQSLMDGLMPLTHEGWMILTRRLMIFFFGLAILNEVIWRTMTEETWVYFKTFGLTAAIFLFFITQGKVFSAHSTEEKKEGE